MPGTRLPLCDDPNALVPEILAEWQAVATEEPWMTLPDRDRFDSLPEVVRGLLDAALCQPNDRTVYLTTWRRRPSKGPTATRRASRTT